MEFVVTRRGELVGFVRADTVEAEHSGGLVTANLQGVRPEDRVRAVFSFETFPSEIEQIRRHVAPSSRADAGEAGSKHARGAKPQRAAALALAGGSAGTFEPMVAAEQDKDKGGPLVKENEERTTGAAEQPR